MATDYGKLEYIGCDVWTFAEKDFAGVDFGKLEHIGCDVLTITVVTQHVDRRTNPGLYMTGFNPRMVS